MHTGPDDSVNLLGIGTVIRQDCGIEEIAKEGCGSSMGNCEGTRHEMVGKKVELVMMFGMFWQVVSRTERHML